MAVDSRNNDIKEIPTEARAVVLGNTLVVVIPTGEFPIPNPKFRFVIFCHEGDFGFQGGAWSADVQPTPEQGGPLVQVVDLTNGEG